MKDQSIFTIFQSKTGSKFKTSLSPSQSNENNQNHKKLEELPPPTTDDHSSLVSPTRSFRGGRTDQPKEVDHKKPWKDKCGGQAMTGSLPSAQCGGARSELSCGDEFVGSIFEPNAIMSDDDDGTPSEGFFTGLPIDGG